jgi:hypothetical protein
MHRRLSRDCRGDAVAPGLLLGAPIRREQTVPLIITRGQRDAIYEIVISHLTAIGDVWLCVKRREFADAKKMGREFAEDLRLSEDLGWSETIDRDTVTLTVPPGELTGRSRGCTGVPRGRSVSMCRARRTTRSSPSA